MDYNAIIAIPLLFYAVIVLIIVLQVIIAYSIIKTQINTKITNSKLVELIHKQEMTNKYLHTIAENQVKTAEILEEIQQCNSEKPSC